MSDGDGEWELVATPEPDGFVVIDDIVGLIMDYCDSRSLLQIRLVCSRWSTHPSFSWKQSLALVKERRRAGVPISIYDAIHETIRFSFDLLIDLDSIRTRHVEPVILQEHERLFPVLGYRKKRLVGDPAHWLQLTGPFRGEIRDRFGACTGGNEWVSDWHPIVSPETDAEGWQYAVGFRTSFGPKTKPFVRRRQWVRLLAVPG